MIPLLSFFVFFLPPPSSHSWSLSVFDTPSPLFSPLLGGCCLCVPLLVCLPAPCCLLSALCLCPLPPLSFSLFFLLLLLIAFLLASPCMCLSCPLSSFFSSSFFSLLAVLSSFYVSLSLVALVSALSFRVFLPAPPSLFIPFIPFCGSPSFPLVLLPPPQVDGLGLFFPKFFTSLSPNPLWPGWGWVKKKKKSGGDGMGGMTIHRQHNCLCGPGGPKNFW